MKPVPMMYGLLSGLLCADRHALRQLLRCLTQGVSVGFTTRMRSRTHATSKFSWNPSYTRYDGIGAICIISDDVVIDARGRSGYKYPTPFAVRVTENWSSVIVATECFATNVEGSTSG